MLFPFSGPRTRPRLPVLLLTMAAAGCGGDAKVTPATPSFSPFEQVGAVRTLEITGSLTTEYGSCLEATILYDGQELLDARARCANPKGCARLDLDAVARTGEGDHTIAFQILGQQPESVEYVAVARVRLSRDGFPGTVALELGPARVTLRSGETVTFDLSFQNSLSQGVLSGPS